MLILICTTFPPYSGLDFCSFDFPFWFCKIFLLCIFPFRLFLSYFHYFVNYCSFPKPLSACLRNLIVYIFNLAMFFSAMDSFVYLTSDHQYYIICLKILIITKPQPSSLNVMLYYILLEFQGPTDPKF